MNKYNYKLLSLKLHNDVKIKIGKLFYFFFCSYLICHFQLFIQKFSITYTSNEFLEEMRNKSG